MSAGSTEMGLPLLGRRILVTRAAHQASRLSDGLRALGAEPVEVPVIEIQPPESYGALDQALRRLESFHWLILTSANTVRVLVERLRQLNLPLPTQPKIAGIGSATAADANRSGIQIDLIPEAYVAESLLKSLLDSGPIAGKRVLIARAKQARDVIPDALRAAGADVTVAEAYRAVLPASAPACLAAALAMRIDAVTFTSSSTARNLAEAAKLAGIAFPFAGVPAISIGPITTRTLRDLGWPPEAEAQPSDIPGLIGAVTMHLNPA